MTPSARARDRGGKAGAAGLWGSGISGVTDGQLQVVETIMSTRLDKQ
jgi:hypothetical protein